MTKNEKSTKNSKILWNFALFLLKVKIYYKIEKIEKSSKILRNAKKSQKSKNRVFSLFSGK